MKHIYLSSLLIIFSCFQSAPLIGQVQMVKNHKPISRIHVNHDNSVEYQASILLRDFIKRISGAELTFVTDGKIKRNDIVIGNELNAEIWNDSNIKTQLKEDGFYYSTDGHILRILSGGDKGSIYAVVSLLETQLGVDYFSENEYSIPNLNTIELPKMTVVDNPAFRYRQSQNYAMRNDSIYKLWYRLEEPREVFAGGYWVHTFDALLPSAIYGE